ncbi:hypothetical protein H2204_005720 [Knufia peltigerae]|uniref:Uncharacterized protein n=1 Tax=Knufia peltigerae TaxID=1002370 RepID=A0AA39CZE4_9EURO|nr:hypothetical protein H2204_005720 [Knufia peltigerae]
MSFDGYGWYLSSTAALLYCSWIVHNIVAWMKIRPFFTDSRSMFKPSTGKWVRRIYLGTLACTVPPIILQIYDNFRFFNNISDFYTKVRPYEPLMRDPWWCFSCFVLFHVIRKCYGTGVFELIKRSPRFGILLVAICLAMIFTAFDIVASIHNFIGSTDGINPFWKLSLVFKCLTDTIMLDDFKTELKRLGIKRMRQDEMRRRSFALVADHDLESKTDDGHMEFTDALNTDPTQFQSLQTFDDRSSPSRGSTGRLRQDSMAETRTESRKEKERVGKAGKRIARLPGLKEFSFMSSSKRHGSRLDDGRRGKPGTNDQENDEQQNSPPAAPERLSQMRQSLGVIDYHAR